VTDWTPQGSAEAELAPILTMPDAWRLHDQLLVLDDIDTLSGWRWDVPDDFTGGEPA
jgi:hypothetical protein